MIISIITINLNNAKGLSKTIESVRAQTFTEIEYIVIDGGSNDGSLEQIIKNNDVITHWISEPDSGIYNAMNKGVTIATGKYVQFLNSGDALASPDAVQKMILSLEKHPDCPILFGNMIKQYSDGRLYYDRLKKSPKVSMLTFYKGTINHSPAFIRRNLFYQYGMYDESLKIVSDWKWYLLVVGWNGEKAIYTDIDVTIFDMTGISNTNKTLELEERRLVLEQILPAGILSDYDMYANSILQTKRINNYFLTRKLVWLLERTLFQFEKFYIR